MSAHHKKKNLLDHLGKVNKGVRKDRVSQLRGAILGALEGELDDFDFSNIFRSLNDSPKQNERLILFISKLMSGYSHSTNSTVYDAYVQSIPVSGEFRTIAKLARAIKISRGELSGFLNKVEMGKSNKPDGYTAKEAIDIKSVFDNYPNLKDRVEAWKRLQKPRNFILYTLNDILLIQSKRLKKINSKLGILN